ncbi:MAG: GNAT family N-acetyltransferase [Enterobacterales bacterium]|nr:GNAT family N-acetyltransferase [Enterobacterales bacterium]
MTKIIKATAQELEPLSQLFNQYRIFYKMKSDPQAAKNFILKRLEQQDSLIYQAINQQTILGFVQIYPSFSSVAMRPIWVINDLYVDVDARNKKVASKLLEHVSQQAKKHHIFNLQLATAIDNHSAQALYTRLGYRLNSQFKHYSRRI